MNWDPIKSIEEDKLKEIAKDIYNGSIFTSSHAGDDLLSVFMTLTLMGPVMPDKPKKPNSKSSVENNRDNRIWELLQYDKDVIKYEEDMKVWESSNKKYKEEYLPSIGMIYEYLNCALPTTINGKPVFFSIRLLNLEDTKKVYSYYETYKNLREVSDNF
jgi:hypothetical protein